MLQLDGWIAGLGVKAKDGILDGKITISFEADEDEHAELVALMRHGVLLSLETRQPAMIVTADLKGTCTRCGTMNIYLADGECEPCRTSPLDSAAAKNGAGPKQSAGPKTPTKRRSAARQGA